MSLSLLQFSWKEVPISWFTDIIYIDYIYIIYIHYWYSISDLSIRVNWGHNISFARQTCTLFRYRIFYLKICEVNYKKSRHFFEQSAVSNIIS